LYGMKDLKGAIGGVTLIKIDLVNNIYWPLPSEVYGLDTVSGKGFIDSSNNQHENIENLNRAWILKHNISSN
jgi:hypothetical protein